MARDPWARRFAWLQRFNQVALALLWLVGAGVLLWQLGQGIRSVWGGRWVEPQAEAANSGDKTRWRFSFALADNIPGTDTQLMRLLAQPESGPASSVAYRSGATEQVRNVVFLSGADKATHWLFADHSRRLLQVVQLKFAAAPRATEEAVTRALYVEYVDRDRDDDGVLTAADGVNIGLSRPDGRQFVEVLHGIDKVLSQQLLDAQHLSVVYQRGSAVRHARFALDTLQPESDREILNVPASIRERSAAP